VLLLLLAIDGTGCSSAMEDGERRKKMTNGARASVIGERGCNEVYVFVYACSWAKWSPYVFCGILVRNE
jgi:hypothetical protein